MKVLKTIGMGLAVLFLIFIVFASWYAWRYAMEPIIPYEVNDPTLENKVLIATQGSEYKYALVEEVVNYLRRKEVYVKVTDISFLPAEQVDDWNAILLVHTWEYSKPPEEVTAFVNANYDPEKVYVITTSGSGEEKMEGIDAVTGASKIDDVQRDVDQVIAWLEKVLGWSKQ